MEELNTSAEELYSQAGESRKESEVLRREIERIMKINSQLTFSLTERVKELNCHNTISEIMKAHDLSGEELCWKIVEILPAAWQFPDLLTVSITFHNQELKSPGFRDSNIKLSQPLRIGNNIIGKIEVCYPGSDQPDQNPEFLPEEENLLLAVSLRICDYLEIEEKKAELIKSENKYRKMVETINDVIYEVTPDGTIKYVSPAIERILGYKPEEITGANFFSFMHPDDRPVLMTALTQLADTDSSYLEYRYCRKDGEIRWVRSSTKPIFENGKLVGGRGALYDIHERKMAELLLQQNEEKYRNIFESTQDVYYEATIDGVLLEISPSIYKISRGQFHKEELIGKSIIGFYSVPEERTHFFSELFKAGSVTDFELTFTNKDGSIIPIAVSSALRFDAAGQPVSVFGSMRDISERKKAQDSIAASELKYKTLF